jgi:hypothetical protein
MQRHVYGDYRGCTEIAKDEERIYKERSVNETNVSVSVIFLFSLHRVLCLNFIIPSSESSCFSNVNKLRSICHCAMDYKILSSTVPRHSMLLSVPVFVSYKTASPHHGLLTGVHKSRAPDRHGD